ARRGRGGCGARRRVGALARRDQVAPPSGVEPEPLGLQPSAQTNYARVGCVVLAPLGEASTVVLAPFHGTSTVVGALPGTHRHRCSVVRDRPPCAGRTSGRDAFAFVASAPVTRDRLFGTRDLE